MNPGTHAQWTDGHATLDVTGDPAGISAVICGGDLDVAYPQLPAVIATLLAGPDGESMTALAARYQAMFTPAPCGECSGTGRVEYDETAPATGPCDDCDGTGRSGPRTVAPQYELLWLTSAFLARLLNDRDYETWDGGDCDQVDGLLREITTASTRLRTILAGTPDPDPCCAWAFR
jgi:hypothetical protein